MLFNDAGNEFSAAGHWNWLHKWLCNKGTALAGPQKVHQQRALAPEGYFEALQFLYAASPNCVDASSHQTNPMKYDVLIVGGGPAGSMAAIQLIGSGLRVAILDRARFPRIKPCGGGISCRAYRRFANLEHVLKSVPTNLVHKLVFESPAGDAVEFSGDGPLYAMIRRLEFDNALLSHCKAGGIEVSCIFLTTPVPRAAKRRVARPLSPSCLHR